MTKKTDSVKLTIQMGPETIAVVEALAEAIGRKFTGLPFTKTAVVQAAIGKGLEQLMSEHGVKGKVPSSVLD